MTWLRWGALHAGAGVALGAFGAHALRSHLSERALAVFETGVRYQLVHSIALIALGLAIRSRPHRLHRWVGRFFSAGIYFFSGSLVLLATTGASAFGMLTPIGGALFLAGWATWARAESRS